MCVDVAVIMKRYVRRCFSMTETKPCPTCEGHEKIRITYWMWSRHGNHVGRRSFVWIPCPTCNGEGSVKG